MCYLLRVPVEISPFYKVWFSAAGDILYAGGVLNRLFLYGRFRLW